MTRFSARLDPTVLLVGLLVAVNLLAVIGMVVARRDARTAVHEGLALETRADARALEARLASEHAQLEFLARSSSLATPPATDNPVARRWARIDLEATLLRYLQSSSAVVRLRVRDETGIEAVAQRVAGVPSLAAPDDRLPFDPQLLRADWRLDGAGRELEAWVDPRPLVAQLGDHLKLHRTPPAAVVGPLEVVSSSRWVPPLEGFVERSESDSRVLGAVDRLADLYRLTLVLNVALLPVTLLLGALTVRRVRRLTRLEGERRQQERLRALELQVQHAERLAGLGRFAAGMAHEINNPLEGVANYLQLLREDLEADRAADAREWLPRIDEGLDRVAGTVRQVLHFAEPGSVGHEPVDLSAVIERTVDFLRRHPDCRAVELRVDVAEGLRLEGDVVGLGQLVLNLVLNACQAHDTAQVEAGAGEVDVVAGRLGDEVEMRVLDRGPGIAPELRDRLFEPFQSGRGSSGLGLAVCHGIVTRHGGRIETHDREGGGTEIRVVLPCRMVEEEG